MIEATLRAAIEKALGGPLTSIEPISGGSIAMAFVAEAAGRPVFVKAHATLPSSVFEREAEGLAWLREAGAVHVPEVVAVAGKGEPGFLVLERIYAFGRPDEETFGRELAALHRAGAPHFGLEKDNHLATLPQENAAMLDWGAFYRDRRLLPLLTRARARGDARPSMMKKLDRVLERIDDLVGPTEAPARLHGDLWSGNRLADESGRSWLVDPAVYGGHREVDLAMMRLFGGFGRRAFEAYDEAFPLATGHAERVPLYQLYPLLAHLVMFGASYWGQVEDAVDAVS